MISSTTTTDRTLRAAPLPASSQPSSPPLALRADQFSNERSAYLKAALARDPAVRPEVVERAMKLVTDPNYPSTEIIRNVAGQILAAPDLSEDQS